MTRHARVPGTRKGGTLYVLPSIPDELDTETKSALALRNACAVEGRCPDCQVVGEIHADRELANVRHLVFRHEPWCRALTDGEDAA